MNSVMECMIKNPYLPFGVLRLLTADKILWAQNLTTPPAVLEGLGQDSDEFVRAEVAFNLRTPVHVLDKLSDDTGWWYVRYRVAENPSTSSCALEKLSRDVNAYVRSWVANHHNTPMYVLDKLSQDDDEDVRYVALERLGT